MAIGYNNIGSVYIVQGNYAKGLEYLEMSLKIFQIVFGEQHPNVASIYNNIGSVYDSQGDYPKALEYYQRSLEIRKVIFGEQHPDVALSYNNIGFVYYSQEKNEKALEYYRKSLSIWRTVFGELHPYVALSYSNIGSAYKSMGNSHNALSNFQKSLSIYLKLYGNNDANVLHLSTVIYNIYCSSLKQASKLKEEYANFISEYAYTLTIPANDNKDSQSVPNVHETYLLEFNNWSMDSTESIFDYNQDNPVDIVIMAYNQIMEFHLDNIEGCEIGLKYVGKEEKRHIVNAYTEWKNKQNQ